MRAKAIAWLSLAVLMLLVPACGRSVTVQPPNAPTESQRCADLKATLPDSFAGERRLTVEPNTPHTAAWGAPPLIWRCGLTDGTDVPAGSQLIVIDGRDWAPVILENGVRFTSVGDSPTIEVTIPADYPNPATLLTRLSQA